MDFIDEYILGKRLSSSPKLEDVASFLNSRIKKEKNVGNIPIEEIQKNILSEYNEPLERRAKTRIFSGAVGGSVANILTAVFLFGLGRAIGFPAIIALPFLAPFAYATGYLFGHEAGASYVNTFHRRRKRKILVGYDENNKPVTIEVFAPSDLKSRPIEIAPEDTLL